MVLAQTDLQEHEARREHEPDPDQHERDHLPDRSTEGDRPNSPRDHEQSGQPERFDAGALAHGWISLRRRNHTARLE